MKMGLVANGTIVTMDESGRVVPNGAVAVESRAWAEKVRAAVR